MRVVYATYIDNQDKIKYPIKFILSKFPQINVFCSDSENEKHLLSEGIKSTIIGYNIKSPIDISIAQNKCIDLIFERQSPDFIVWCQADIFITKKGESIISDFCNEKNINQTCALGLMHIKLFHHCGHSYYGVNIIGREAWKRIKYTGDGAYLGQGGADYCEKEDASIDIGYMTIEQCRNHLKQHQKTWNTPDDIINYPDSDFVKSIIKRSNYSGLITEDSEYFYLIKEMGLEKEYLEVKKWI